MIRVCLEGNRSAMKTQTTTPHLLSAGHSGGNETRMRGTLIAVERMPVGLLSIVLALVYFALAKLSLAFAVAPGYATAVWPPSGLAVAAALLFGNRIWPGVWLGAAAVNFTVGSSFVAAVAVGSGNTLEALAAATMIRRFMGVPFRFEHGEDVIVFMMAAALSALIAAGFGVVPITAGNNLGLEATFVNAWTWWLGDVAGIIIFVPLILSWSSTGSPAWSPPAKVELVLFAVLVLFAAYLAFSGGARYSQPIPRSYLMVPFVLWGAFRFGQRETTTAVAALYGVALWHTLAGSGPFAMAEMNASLLLLLTYTIVLQGIGLVLSAVIGERSRAMAQLREERDELETRVRSRTLELEHINRVLNRDIVEREKAELRFKRLLESAPDAMVIIDKDGNVVLVNSQVEKLFGYPRHELVSRPAEMLLSRRYRAADNENGARYFRETQARPMGSGLELHGLHRKGDEFPIEISVSPLATEEGTLVVIAIRDISERKLAEATRARLAAIVESSQDAILSRDLSGRVLSWNVGAERLFGYTAAEVIGRDLTLVPPERTDEISDNRRLIKQGLQVSNYQTVRLAKDGRRIDVSLSGSAVMDDNGNIIGMASILRDITPLKRAEQALQKAHDDLETRVAERTAELSRINAELEKFAYIASHDLQEPLRTVINFSDLLERRYSDKLDADGREFMGFIVNGVGRMRRLIDDLLEFSRMGQERVVRQTVDSEAVLGQVLANLGQSLAECETVVTHDSLPTVLADPGQLEQLLQNLIGNAIKFRSAEAPTVHIGVETEAADWVFSVRDNGIGLDPRFANRIFEMFQRLHGASKFAGSGVGLAICKKIVERHAGRIWVESTEGHGATFYFTLPRQ
ncbi:MAG: sensory transduction histidine kinase [Betaproteobacteria bacterium]|nr:sensory transduction histidine kinase [Betaproteobacteria bacterium]